MIPRSDGIAGRRQHGGPDMRRVLMVTPHFPPDNSAAAHRVRLLAPYLPQEGWEPTIVTVSPDAYEGELDRDLLDLVPSSLRVIRCRAMSPAWTRRFGIGDLGLRAFPALWQTCSRLLIREQFDALFITIYPVYPALLGPVFKRRFGVPFVLDYQDPWIGSWGLSVGGGAAGTVDLKSRASRRLGRSLEPFAVEAADAITAVSPATYRDVLARIGAAPICEALPLGWEPSDFARVADAPNPFFDPSDGRVHLSYVGTLLPAGIATLDALLEAVALMRDRDPALYARLRMHFFGTSNQRVETVHDRVMPRARARGIGDVITETAPRIGYLDALRVLKQSTAILLLGSREPHYTASKLYPALLARRPLLALFHQASTVVDVLDRVSRPPTVRIVRYSEADRGTAPPAESVYVPLSDLVRSATYDPQDIDWTASADVSAAALARRLASVFDRVCAAKARTAA